jgi:hypothetical protein
MTWCGTGRATGCGTVGGASGTRVAAGRGCEKSADSGKL